MTTIRITEFKGYSNEDIIEFLKIHRKSFYEVSIPKTCAPDVDIERFLQDYYNAMYTGQLLYRISHDIFWTTPDPYTTEEFSFMAITTAYKTFAGYIHYLTKAFDPSGHPDEASSFEQTAYYLTYLKDEEKLACYEFADVIMQYTPEVDN